MNGKHISVKEAAERLGYTVQHTRLLIRHQQLRGEKIGRDWLVEALSVQRMLMMKMTSVSDLKNMQAGGEK